MLQAGAKTLSKNKYCSLSWRASRREPKSYQPQPSAILGGKTSNTGTDYDFRIDEACLFYFTLQGRYNLPPPTLAFDPRLRFPLLMSLEDLQGFRNLSVKGFGTFQKMEQLGVVHFEQHTSNFSGKLGL